MECCEICGAVHDLYEYDIGRFCCQRGKCGFEMQRQEREDAQEELERDLEEVYERHGYR